MYQTTYKPPPRPPVDPTKPVPNFPPKEDIINDNLLLLSIVGQRVPSLDALSKYRPRDWNKIEHLELFLRNRKAQYDSELNALSAHQAKALQALDRALFLAAPSEDHAKLYDGDALLQAMDEQRVREFEMLDRRYKRLNQIVAETYWRDVLPKQKALKQIYADPQPKNYPNIPPPKDFEAFKQLPEYMKKDCAKLIQRHVDNVLYKAHLRDSRWYKDKEVSQFDAARDSFKSNRDFRDLVKKQYDVIKDW